ncbi:sigma-54-dependent Fis family transcriptional regulator [candidate division WOR-3 bacterium]|nr:sigma-54-dependent Fis family transcriptional regulator [candidate division WOR-3 bacterium]
MNPDTELIRVLLVDDEVSFLEATSAALKGRQCDVTTSVNAQQAIEHLESRFFDVIVLDVQMPGMDGLALLKKLSDERPTLKVVMLTGHATVEMAIEAMKLGAFDFLLKPAKIEDLLKVVRRAAERGELERRNIALEEELERTKGSGRIVGESSGIKKIREFILTAASADLPVLITGETGTGKELVAQAIHAGSARSSHQLVIVDGSTLREELLASELFGHEKGAFTGAVKKKVGLFEVADRGSIFLDEIGELSAANQTSLLRVLESGRFRPVGAVREVSTDVRIIAATNKDIKAAVGKGGFREDLFYRLNGLSIDVLPLRERRDDIPLLAQYFLDLTNSASGTTVKLSKDAQDSFLNYDWPGNIRELKYVIERAVLLARKTGEIGPSHLPEDVAKTDKGTISIVGDFTQDRPTLSELQERYERFYIESLIEEYKGNKSKVARVLGISRSVLYEKLGRLGME